MNKISEIETEDNESFAVKLRADHIHLTIFDLCPTMAFVPSKT